MMGARTVLITGGAQGLGAALARRFYAAGYCVAIGDIDKDAADHLADELSCGDGRTLAIALDVREKLDLERALATTIGSFDRVDVLINNAAVTQICPLFEISAEQFDAVLAVNLRGTFLASQVFGAHFRDKSAGRIINLASLAGQNGGAATGAHYAASKGGILTLTKVFARELAASGVTVNAIAPGPLDLPGVHEMLGDKVDQVREAIPVGQFGAPDFIADIAVMLAGPDAGAVTGATWDANGGLYLR